MTEIGRVMESLEIPGSDVPPETVLSAANEAASVGAGGLWQTVRHKWVVGLIALSLVGVPTAFAVSSHDGTPNNLVNALLEQRREILKECVDSPPGALTFECSAAFDEVRNCLKSAGPDDPSCASVAPNIAAAETSVPLKDLAATAPAERPLSVKLGSVLRKLDERRQAIR